LLKLWPSQAENIKNNFSYASSSKIHKDANRNGEFVYHDFKITYKRFESSSTKADRWRS